MQGVIIEFTPGEKRVIDRSLAVAKRAKRQVQSILAFVWDVSDAGSQFLSTLFGGMPGQTLASRAGRNKHLPFWNALRKLLNLLFSPRTKLHCERAIQRDLERSKAILSIRKPYYRV
jgi:hypothetical protein